MLITTTTTTAAAAVAAAAAAAATTTTTDTTTAIVFKFWISTHSSIHVDPEALSKIYCNQRWDGS